MTVEELEGKLTNIYHEFAETISENETDEQIVARSKEWFVKRLSEETDNKEAIESIANQLVGCLKQASVLSNLEKEKNEQSLDVFWAYIYPGKLRLQRWAVSPSWNLQYLSDNDRLSPRQICG